MHSTVLPEAAVAAAEKPSVAFVAVNFIHCEPDYVPRFEELFRSRAHAIDRIPGFVSMRVLKPSAPGGDYLVVSEWSEAGAFESWKSSPEFLEGHKRGFADVRAAREEGRTPPMTSRFETYSVLCD